MAEPFIERVADRLASVPGILAVHFGGSRVAGSGMPTSDWDVAIYYRRRFDVNGIRELSWAGVVSDIGDWGPVMNGGAWVTVEDKAVDIHYRDLDEIERLKSEAARGEFSVYRIPFFVAGIPSYVPLAELALGITLRGELPIPEFTDALQRSASAWWRSEAEKDLGYAAGLVERSPAVALGLLTRVMIEAAHGRLCAQGKWITNEKRVMLAAGLQDLQANLMRRLAEPEPLPDVANHIAAALDLKPFSPR